jgi:WD40 repeat protein
MPTGLVIVSASDIQRVPRSYIKSYSFNLSATSVGFSRLYPEHALSAMIEPLSRKDIHDVFMLATSSQSLAEEPDKMGVLKYNKETKALTSYKSSQGKSERHFAWSDPAKLLAFNRIKTSIAGNAYSDLLPVDNWEIALINPESDTLVAMITDAVNPEWSPDGKQLLYLKVDGLYVWTLETREEQRVISVPDGGVVTSMSMIAVSPDHTKLMWTVAKAGVISLYAITAWNTFTVQEIARMQVENTEFYWPLFSPDSNFFAVQAIDILQGNDLFRQNARIEIRGIENTVPSVTYPLTQFNFDQLFTDSWVENL